MGLFSELYNNNCPDCFQTSIQEFVKSEYLATTSILNEVIQDFNNGNRDQVNSKLFDLYYNNLNKGIRNVFKPESKNNSELNYYYKLDANAAKFAAYKSHFVSNKLRELVGDEDYDAKAKNLLKRFNRFQMVEYNTTVSRCRTAKQFAQFKKIESYANIEWLRTRSASPREQHLKFAGLILPKNHDFWKRNQPGNLWQCKCDWRLTNEVVSADIPEDVKMKGLGGNPSLSREIFSSDHPYFSQATNVGEVDKFISDAILNQFEKVDGYFYHPLVSTQNENIDDLKLIARLASGQGKSVYVFPTAENTSELYYHLYKMRGALEGKCPDYLIDDVFYDFKSHIGKFEFTKIQSMISSAVKQSDSMIIDLRLSNDVSFYKIKENIYKRIKDGQNISSVYALMPDNRMQQVFP